VEAATVGLEKRPTDPPRLREEARYHLAARRELGPDLDEHLVDSFMEQVRVAIADEVARQVRQREIDSEKLWDKRKEVLGITLGTGIPLMLVAGVAGGLLGVVVVCVMLVLVNIALIGVRR
jgi:hypothetical protein